MYRPLFRWLVISVLSLARDEGDRGSWIGTMEGEVCPNDGSIKEKRLSTLASAPSFRASDRFWLFCVGFPGPCSQNRLLRDLHALGDE